MNLTTIYNKDRLQCERKRRKLSANTITIAFIISIDL